MYELAEWLREPGFVGTHATMGADISQLMATVFTTLFIVGWIQAKKHKADHHHWLMFGGMVAMLAFFISYYLFRNLGVLAFEGKEGFGGSQALYNNVFIPLLTVHIILVVIGLIMATMPTVTKRVKTLDPMVSETATSVSPFFVALYAAAILGIEGTNAPIVIPTKRGSKLNSCTIFTS